MSVTFRPTPRTRILMILVLVAGVIGAVVLWRELSGRAEPAPAAPRAPNPAVVRALTQLEQRTGRPMQLAYAAARPSGAVCGYAGSRRSAEQARRPLAVTAFIAFPDRVVLSADDPNFGALLARTCPGFPGAPAP